MLTTSELIRVLLAPAVIGAIIAGVARWRRWGWGIPVGAGVAFLVAYSMVGVPGLPPRDGTDWLFWLAMPLTALGVAGALWDRWWATLFGAAGGVAAWVIVRPLVPHAVSTSAMVWTSLGLAVVMVAGVFVVWWSAERVDVRVAAVGLAIVLAGAGVVVMSSNLRVVGVYGLAAAAGVGGVALLTLDRRALVGLGIFALPLLAGILAGGRFYPEPGVTWGHFWLIAISPVMLGVGAIVPVKRRWVRSMVALLAVCAVVGVVAGPTALSAKKAAETPTTVEDYYELSR